MFSRLCKRYHGRIDNSVLNLQKFRIFSSLPQEDNYTEEKIKEKDKRDPLIICKRPQFNFYKGKTFSKFEIIPLASQGWHHAKSVGDHFTILPDYEDNVDDEVDEEKPKDFNEFGLDPKLVENLSEANVHTPTEIQTVGVPHILTGQNCSLSAETGCGKTITYLLPMIQQILGWKRYFDDNTRGPNTPFGLVITPSRELAHQIGKEAKKLVRGLDINVRVITGGRTKRLSANPHVADLDILIGSFGVVSKMTTTRIFKLGYVRHVVLDEAHALFDVTFEEKLDVFLHRLHFDRSDETDASGFPTSSQLTLVSATKNPELPNFFKEVVSADSIVDLTTDNFQRVMVPQKFMRVAAVDKPMILLKLVKRKAMKKNSFIVFSNNSSTCDWISLFLNEFSIRTVHLNGEMTVKMRKDKFAAFQRGDFTVLSATNAGARGLDTVKVNDVINYDFPMETADYVHRCGRTGRLGSKGECRVTNLISRGLEIELTQKIERAARRRRPIPIFNILDEKAKREINDIEALTGVRRKRKNLKPKTMKKSSRTKKMAKTRKNDSSTETV